MFRSVLVTQLIQDGYVAPLPIIARERISRRYSCELTKSGCEIEGIAKLRSLIESLDHDFKFARAILISAPHTHWGDETIVESYDPLRRVFLNGPVRDADARGDLRPISFVFSADKAVPYEWADNTVPLNLSDLEEVYSFIARLNELVANQFRGEFPLTFGIMIDHRFKPTIWDEQLFSFAEGPHDEEDGRAVVWPVFQSVLHDNPAFPNTVQVGWSAFPNSSFFDPALNSTEFAVLSELEALVREREPEEARRFVEELEEYLRTKVDA